jgi:Zn-finger nucleic acid-binding protein
LFAYFYPIFILSLFPQYYPFGQKYVSLFAADSEASNESRNKMRELVRAAKQKQESDRTLKVTPDTSSHSQPSHKTKRKVRDDEGSGGDEEHSSRNKKSKIIDDLFTEE